MPLEVHDLGLQLGAAPRLLQIALPVVDVELLFICTSVNQARLELALADNGDIVGGVVGEVLFDLDMLQVDLLFVFG